MNRWLFQIPTAALALAVLAGPATAHEPFVEEEMARRTGSLVADEDFSFTDPFVIEGNIEESRAIFSYLHPGDVDVFTFTLTPGDFLVPGIYPPVFAPVIVTASALPPACVSYNAAYPVSALLGPGLPPPPADVELPFDVPAGLGVVYAPNPALAPGLDRPVFNFPEAEYAWLLPQGLTEYCLLYAPFLCDFSNTISTPVFVPGTYFIAMWNPTGKPMDYTANLGFREDLFQGPADTPEKIAARARADTITPMIERFKMNAVPCNEIETRP